MIHDIDAVLHLTGAVARGPVRGRRRGAVLEQRGHRQRAARVRRRLRREPDREPRVGRAAAPHPLLHRATPTSRWTCSRRRARRSSSRIRARSSPGAVDPLALLAGIQRTKLTVPAGEPLTLELIGVRAIAAWATATARPRRAPGATRWRWRRRCARRCGAGRCSGRRPERARTPRASAALLIVAGRSLRATCTPRGSCARCASSARCDVRGVAGPRLRAAGVETLVPQEDAGGDRLQRHRRPAAGAVRAPAARCSRSWSTSAPTRSCWWTTRASTCASGPELKRRGARVLLLHRAPGLGVAPGARAARWRAGWTAWRWCSRSRSRCSATAGVATTFVGHPLLDELAPEIGRGGVSRRVGAGAERAHRGAAARQPPRRVAAHARVLLEAARRCCAPRVPTWCRCWRSPRARSRTRCRAAAPTGVRVVSGRTRCVQAYAACCAVASGTATLETALFGTPLVVVLPRRLAQLTRSRKRVVTLSHIGLPNIVAGSEVAPELMQGAFTPSALARLLGGWLDDAGDAGAPARGARRRARAARAGLAPRARAARGLGAAWRERVTPSVVARAAVAVLGTWLLRVLRPRRGASRRAGRAGIRGRGRAGERFIYRVLALAAAPAGVRCAAARASPCW